MSLTPSNMLALGTIAPDFNLPDTVSGKNLSLSELKSDVATVVMFICNHCPYVIHVQKEMVAIANDYSSKGMKFIAISSNDVDNYPTDSPEFMKIEAQKNDYNFPYLFDENQEVAKAFMAACTPDFYILDGHLKCVYRGRMDESSPGNGKPNNGADIRNALDAILENKEVSKVQMPSIGCNIKWK